MIGEYVNDFVDEKEEDKKYYYMGGSKDGVYSGLGRLLWHDGTQYIGCFKDGKKHGFGVYKDNDNVVHIAYYYDNWVRNGRVIFLGINRLSLYNYCNDIIDGRCYEIENGKILIMEYSMGEMISSEEYTCDFYDISFALPDEVGVKDVKVDSKNRFTYDRKGKNAIWQYEENMEEMQFYSIDKDNTKKGLSLRYSKINDCFYLANYDNDKVVGKYLQITNDKFVYGGYSNGYLEGNVYTFEKGILTLSKARKKTIVDVISYGTKKEKVVSLNELVGLSKVKREVKRIRAYVRKNNDKKLNIHMCFTGNPGTGKTCVARLLASILYEEGVLPKDSLIEIDRSGLVAEYLGQTEAKTKKIINESLGGVLFIDEAYTLDSPNRTNDYGSIAVAMLLKEMEDKRGKFCCILAGYKKEMDELLASNPGFKSRIQFHIDFPNYTIDELMEILGHRLKEIEYQATDEAVCAMKSIILKDMLDERFANARAIRNILDKIVMIQNERTIDDNSNRTIDACDVRIYESEQK